MRLSVLVAGVYLVVVNCSAGIISNLAQRVLLQSAHQEPLLATHDPADWENRLLKLHKALVDIPSVSRNEQEVTKFLKSWLELQGLHVEPIVVSKDPPREDLYAYWGDERDVKVLVSSHVDTVPPFFPYSVEGDKIYGRGSVDAKASVASQIEAVLELREEEGIEDGDVGLLFVVGEEHDGIGMKTASKKLQMTPKVAIFGEPTESKLSNGHKGLLAGTIKVKGVAAHSGYPYLGVDANKILIDLLYDLEHAEWPISETLGNTTLNVGIIKGGESLNVVSPFAIAQFALRISGDIDKSRQIISDTVAKYENATVNIFSGHSEVALDHDVPGFDTITCAYFTDIPYLEGNFTRYLYGPGTITVAHGANEYVTKSELLTAVEDIKTLIKYSL